MSNPNVGVVVSSTTPNGQLVEKDGKATRAFLIWMRNVGATVNQGFDADGNYQGPIGARATIVGRKFLATIVQHLTDLGVMRPEGLPAASVTEQGAVIMPAGATSNTLGTAAIEPSAAFDVAGAAAAAQVAAEAHADLVAAAAQAAAEAFASDAGNLTAGTLDRARLDGISVTVTTAALTGPGAQGSMTFVNGLLVAQVQAT